MNLLVYLKWKLWDERRRRKNFVSGSIFELRSYSETDANEIQYIKEETDANNLRHIPDNRWGCQPDKIP